MSTEVRKTVKFQRGLRADIRHVFGGTRSVDYATIVQRAHAIKRDRDEWGWHKLPRRKHVHLKVPQIVRIGSGQSDQKIKQTIHNVISVEGSTKDRA